MTTEHGRNTVWTGDGAARGDSERPIVGVTLGDTSGIGPEIVAKLLARAETYALARPVVLGDVDILAWGAEIAGVPLAIRAVHDPDDAGLQPGVADVLDHGLLSRSRIRLGEVSAQVGRAMTAQSRTAVELALSGRIAGVVSGPSSKESLHLACPEYESDAGLFAGLARASPVQGMIGVGAVRVFPLTQHVALAKVASLVTKERVLETIHWAQRYLPLMGVETPRIGVAGLNPHAGDGGLFGREEIEEIGPAIEAARAEGIDARGPVPDDTVFVRANRGEFDAVVAMFHAQSNIAVKLLGFGRGVSATLGLPFPRVTTAHGTGFDIAGKGVASAESLADAFELVASMATSARRRGR